MNPAKKKTPRKNHGGSQASKKSRSIWLKEWVAQTAEASSVNCDVIKEWMGLVFCRLDVGSFWLVFQRVPLCHFPPINPFVIKQHLHLGNIFRFIIFFSFPFFLFSYVLPSLCLSIYLSIFLSFIPRTSYPFFFCLFSVSREFFFLFLCCTVLCQ